MIANPEQVVFPRDYCKLHPQHFLSFICAEEQCDYYLTLECEECKIENKGNHSHELHKTCEYAQDLHKKTLVKLTTRIEHEIDDFVCKLKVEIDVLRAEIKKWYSPMDESATEKEFIHHVENPGKWKKIQQATNLKDCLITAKLSDVFATFKSRLDSKYTLLEEEMRELKDKAAPQKWKFDRNSSHHVLNIGGFADRTIDKKVQKQSFCVSLLNQPITPFKEEINFVINSQNLRDKLLVIGLARKREILNVSYETNLKVGIYAIYQAAKNGGSNQAFSLHCSNPDYHFKESVGWNFKSGDIVTLMVDFEPENQIILHFRKKGIKESYEMPIRKEEGFLYPFIALYSSGDKVSIEQNL